MTVKEFLTISSIATEPEVIRTKLDELRKPYQLGQYKTPDTLNDINMGELLGINDSWFRFIFVLTVDSEEKSKSLTENGFYICVNESVSPYDNTFLIVLSAQNDNTVVQFLVSANGKSVKVRTKWWRDGWSEWNLIGS